MDPLPSSRMAAVICLAFATLVDCRGAPGGFPGWGGYGPGSGSGSNGFGGFGGGNNGGNGDGDGNGDGNFPGADFLGFDINTASYYRWIHGILCSLAMVILFPLGSILMRLVPGRFAIWAHGIFQMLALAVYVAGAGLGIYLATYITIPFTNANLLTNEATSYHPIIGLVVLATLLVQPVLGVVHHSRFKRVGRRQVWSYLHIFNGRIGVTIGIINGGLGLNLAAASAYHKRVYIIVAAIMWSLWMLVALWAELMRLRRNRREAKAAGTAAAATPVAMTGAKSVGLRRSDSHSERRTSRSTSRSRRSREVSRV